MEKKIKEREYAQKVIKENEEKMQKKIEDKYLEKRKDNQLI